LKRGLFYPFRPPKILSILSILSKKKTAQKTHTCKPAPGPSPKDRSGFLPFGEGPGGSSEAAVLPLLTTPRNARALQRLIAPNLPVLRAYPLPWWQWALLGAAARVCC
jgi:hypothetical protein